MIGIDNRSSITAGHELEQVWPGLQTKGCQDALDTKHVMRYAVLVS